MKVLRLHEPYDMRFHDEPVPEIGLDEVLIKVGSVGVCASDLHYYRSGHIGDQVVEQPVVLGHEFSGTVVKIGERVKTLSVGARVAVEPGKSCKECEQCRDHYTNLCRNVQFFGTPPIDGVLREFVAWPAELCYQVSESVSLDAAAMVEPLAVGVYAVDLAEMAGGESVVVLGAGAVGLSVIQAARVVGAGKIVVSDPVPERCDIALKLGADMAVDAGPQSTAEITEETRGAEIVFECAGMPEAVWQSVEVARPRGRVLVIGIPQDDRYCFPASAARRRAINIQFVRRSLNTTERSVEMVERRLVNAQALATHYFPFDKAEDALKLAEEKSDGVVRAVVRVSEESCDE